MADPRTAPAVAQMLSAGSSALSNAGGDDPTANAMIQAMISGMPLKSFISFGQMNAEQVDGLIAMLNGLTK